MIIPVSKDHNRKSELVDVLLQLECFLRKVFLFAVDENESAYVTRIMQLDVESRRE